MKIEKPSATLDHMMRQTRLHHAQLSMMADNKANMLLTISSVVISLSLPHMFTAGPVRLSLFVLVLFSLVTVALAVYAVMPKIPFFSKPRVRPDLANPRFNLLFFGDFTRLSYPEFEAAMEETMNDPSRTYEVQVREIYTLGAFLATKKYRFLQLAYLAFFTGILGSVIALFLSAGFE
jgi:Pycsar effector protein